MQFIISLAAEDMPPLIELIENNIKTIIEYKRNDEGKKVKVTQLKTI